MIRIKSQEEIETMREGGRILASILKAVRNEAKPGVSILKLDELAYRMTKEAGAEPSFLGYGGYPKSICASVNDEVVHGIPNDRILMEGDIISIDAGVYYKGFHTDSAITIPVGAVSKEAQKLIDVTQKSLKEGIKLVKPGRRLGDVSARIQEVAEGAGYGVVRSLVGHGVGRSLHEDPQVPNFGEKGKGVILREGMVLAIEPMVTAGDFEVSCDDDNWTIRTLDKSLSAHFEHTVAVTANGHEILTV